MIGATIGIDLTFNVANVFISTNLPSQQQDTAGALTNTLLYLGIAFLLAFADVVQTETEQRGLKQSYQYVFWFTAGCSVLSLAILLFFVRIPKAESDLIADGREALRTSRDSDGGAGSFELRNRS